MAISGHNVGFLESFLGEMGDRYLNMVVDQAGLAMPSAYCSYRIAGCPAESVILIDGANSFNPYHVTHYSRLFGVDERRAMRRIQLSRAFTCHQMTALLGERLETAAKRFGASTVVISDPTYIYVERSAEEDVVEEFISAHQRLSDITYSLRLTALVVHSGHVPRFLDGGVMEDGKRERAARSTERVLFRLSDSVYRLEECQGGFSATRIKHPLLPRGPAYFIPAGSRTMTLDEVLQGIVS
jgi:hypothetical protein